MSTEPQEATEVVRARWSTDGDGVDLDDQLGPQKVCRNMRDFTFEDLADDGEDAGQVFRSTLAREGKRSGSSLADLISDRAVGTPD